VLSKVYNEFKEKKYEIEIVFGTSDRSKQEFEEYYSTMPFLAFPF
jgi:nucleoredoxin